MRKLIFVITFIALFTLTSGVLAQEGDIPPTRVDHEQVIDLIINTVSGLVIAAFGSAPVTVAITSILKKISFFDRWEEQSLAFGTAALLFVGALVASATGRQIEFESILDLITVVGPAILAFITTLIAAPAEYHVAKAFEVPVIGEKRSSTAQEIRWE